MVMIHQTPDALYLIVALLVFGIAGWLGFWTIDQTIGRLLPLFDDSTVQCS